MNLIVSAFFTNLAGQEQAVAVLTSITLLATRQD